MVDGEGVNTIVYMLRPTGPRSTELQASVPPAGNATLFASPTKLRRGRGSKRIGFKGLILGFRVRGVRDPHVGSEAFAKSC